MMAHIAEAIQQGLTSAGRSDCEGVLTTLLITVLLDEQE
jgi:hypothetical protein